MNRYGKVLLTFLVIPILISSESARAVAVTSSPGPSASPAVDPCGQCQLSAFDGKGQVQEYCINYVLINTEIALNTVLRILYGTAGIACGIACYTNDLSSLSACAYTNRAAALTDLASTLTLLGLGEDWFSKWNNMGGIFNGVTTGASMARQLYAVGKTATGKLEIESSQLGSLEITPRMFACMNSASNLATVAFKTLALVKAQDNLNEACNNIKSLRSSFKYRLKDFRLFMRDAYAAPGGVESSLTPLRESPATIAENYLKGVIPIPATEAPFSNSLENLQDRSQILGTIQRMGLSTTALLDKMNADPSLMGVAALIPGTPKVFPDMIQDIEERVKNANPQIKMQKNSQNSLISTQVNPNLQNPVDNSAANSNDSLLGAKNTDNNSDVKPGSEDYLHSKSAGNIFQIISNRIQTVESRWSKPQYWFK